MSIKDYYSSVENGVEFLIAFVSLLCFLGLIAGIAILLFGGRFSRSTSIKITIISLIGLGITGFYTGIKYFRI